jgi:hypothetical protein
MKIIKGAELISENDFTKIFKFNDIDVYLTKAVDEDSNSHFLVASVPRIDELDVSHLQYPFKYDTTEDRDMAFKEFNVIMVEDFIYSVIAFIKEQKEKQKDESIS